MTTENYNRLIDDICALARLPNPQHYYGSADLAVDGVNFTLIEASDGADAGMALYCDFGAPPVADRAGVLGRLLEINLALHGINPAQFMLNAETGHVLLGRRIYITKLPALELMNLLTQYAAQAREWRSTFFLQDARKAPWPNAAANQRLRLGL